jgi:dTMP kinase
MAALTARGRFITLEGGEGAGKSGHAQRLAKWLKGQGIGVLVTREPGGSPRAEALRRMLLAGRFASHGPETEALVFALARADHLSVTIRPALKAGTWVICDRFMDSTRAYQGTAGADAALLDLLDEIVVEPDRPDLTLILDVPADAGLKRTEGRAHGPDRFERDAIGMHEARRRTFLDIAARDPKRCVVIDTTPEKAVVAKTIRKAVTERLLTRAGKRG